MLPQEKFLIDTDLEQLLVASDTTFIKHCRGGESHVPPPVLNPALSRRFQMKTFTRADMQNLISDLTLTTKVVSTHVLDGYHCTSRLVPIMLIFCLLFCSIILQQALIIPKRFVYYSQQETYYSDLNRHCYGKIVHGTPIL